MSSKVLQGYLTEAQAARELGRTVRALRHWRTHRRGPPYTPVGGTVGGKDQDGKKKRAGTILYRRESLLRWLEHQEVHPVRERDHRRARS